MGSPATWATLIGALVAFLAGATKASQAVWAAATALREAITSVQANTSATADLAKQFAAHRDQVVGRLDAHDQRLTALESGTPGVPESGSPVVGEST